MWSKTCYYNIVLQHDVEIMVNFAQNHHKNEQKTAQVRSSAGEVQYRRLISAQHEDVFKTRPGKRYANNLANVYFLSLHSQTHGI